MQDTFTKILDWIKANLLYVGIGLVAVIFIIPKLFKKAPRKRRTLPRSAGRRIPIRTKRTNKPAQRSADGKKKKPWQIKGSLAARRHMAQIRKRR